HPHSTLFPYPTLFRSFIGKGGLAALAQKAHRSNVGVIALVYMSHPEAKEGFGLEVGGRGLYREFLDRAAHARVDGIVVGAAQLRSEEHTSELQSRFDL